MNKTPSEDAEPVIGRLIQRMDADPGFAGLGASIQTISAVSDDADSGAREIAAAILRDGALTARLLRFANSSSQGRSNRNVSTVDQALVIVGLKTVKSLALSLALLDALSSKPQSNQLHAEIVASYFCGALAADITRLNGPRYNQQEAQVCGLLQNLGRMMALYYLYDEIEGIRALQIEENLPEEEAVQRTLGMGFDEIGAAIAHHWNLPYVIQQSLEPLNAKSPPRAVPTNAVTWHQACTTFARQVADTLFRLPENREKPELAAAIEFFRVSLRLKEEETFERIDHALVEVGNLLEAISFPCTLDNARALLRKTSERAHDILSSQDRLTRLGSKAEGKTPIEMIQYILRLVHAHYRFDRTLLCLPDGSSGLMAIAGVGRNIGQVTPKFRCFGAKPDLFRVVVAKKVDAYIPNVRTPAYEKLFPEWYGRVVGARACLLLPLVHDGKCLGLLYGDYDQTPESPPAAYAEGSMQTWRHQIVQSLHSAK